MLRPFPFRALPLLAASALALASCADEPEELIPAPEAAYSRTVTYLDQASPARHDTAYRSSALEVAAKLSPTACTIQLGLASKQEGLALGTPRTQLPATLLGSYAFRAPVNPSQAPSYEYWVNKADKPAGGDTWSYGSWWLPSTGAAAGAVEITRYDARRQLLSGQFKLLLTGMYDPRARSTEFSTRRCDLTVQGTFTNVPLTSVP